MNGNPITAETAAQTLSAYVASLGLEPQSSYSTQEVLFVLEQGQYDADRATVAEFVRKKYIGPVKDGTWSPVEFYEFLRALEARRRWQHGSEFHRLKKSAAQLEYEQAVDTNNKTYMHDIGEFTLEDILFMLARCDQPGLREYFLLAAQLKLTSLGFKE